MKGCIVFCCPIFILPKQISETEENKQYAAHMGMRIHMDCKCAKEQTNSPHLFADFYFYSSKHNIWTLHAFFSFLFSYDSRKDK